MIPSSAQGATKLLEALEKLSQWAGEPSGERPSGTPSRELVRAFEEALSTAPAEGPAAAAAEGVTAAPTATMFLPGPAESMPCPPELGRKLRCPLWSRPGMDLPWSGPPQLVALMSPPGRR